MVTLGLSTADCPQRISSKGSCLADREARQIRQRQVLVESFGWQRLHAGSFGAEQHEAQRLCERAAPNHLTCASHTRLLLERRQLQDHHNSLGSKFWRACAKDVEPQELQRPGMSIISFKPFRHCLSQLQGSIDLNPHCNHIGPDRNLRYWLSPCSQRAYLSLCQLTEQKSACNQKRNPLPTQVRQLAWTSCRSALTSSCKS